jgi:hypothetical protein
MKTIGTLTLITMLFISNGCMTYSSVQRAQGRGGEWVEIKATDQIVRDDGTNCVIKRIGPNGGTNEMRLHLETPKAGTTKAGYVCKPAYYALLPLTIPADIATFPFQLIFFMAMQGSS